MGMSADKGGLIKLTALVEGDRAAIAELVVAANEDPDEKPWEIELRKVKRRRSLDANAYAWVLIDKLAARLRTSKEDVYRNVIREIPGVSDIVCCKAKASKALMENWQSRGIGWQAEEMPSKLAGCVNVVLYYGSSVYDKQQMTALIDELVRECREQRIETLSPAELARLEGLA